VTTPVLPRLGLLGGTFDPPHVGHLAAARAVRDAVSGIEISLVVANDPWQKSDARQITNASLRVMMTRALVNHEPQMSVDDREVRRGGPTYTVDTLTELHAENSQRELFLIVGADTASRIHTWHRSQDLIPLSTLIVVNRPGTSINLAPEMAAWNHIVVPMNPVDVSSTAIRTAVANGDSISTMTTPSVAALISDNGLYREATR
jgi:nicotinate-nucleotide adenylyltransferase